MSSTVQDSPDLAQRLAEAEATIEALLSGQIDAVVDSKSKTPVLLAKAQEALRESEDRYRVERDRAQRYLDTAEVMLLGLDATGKVAMANRYACAVLGWPAEELIGRDFIETCVPARVRDETRIKLGHVHGGPNSSIVNNPIVTRSGDERMIEWRNRLQRDDDGRVISTLSSGTDVTERNLASESLRISDERTRFMLQAANVGIWDMDYATGALTWSETLEAQYGLAPGTFGGTFEAFVERIHPDDRATVMGTIGDAMELGSDFSVQNRSVWPDGTVRWLAGAGRVHSNDLGEPVRAIGISLDVTELHKLEAQYQQAQKMEAVGRLAGGVAHDFNNLLMVITGYSDLLLQGLMVGDSRREDLEQIRKAADGAAALTKQLLAFSRQQVIQPTMIGLEDVVTSATEMLKRLIGEDVELLTHLSEMTATVYIDAGQLEQVIMNLAVNARDAMPTGGTLTIDTSVVTLSEKDARAQGYESPGRFALLSVTDTGTGMDEQTRSRIFEPFFTTKEQGKGTGLGLATVYGIVKQANGSIEVISAPDRGTVFKIYLPFFEDAVEVKDGGPAIPITPRGVETILLVEDSTGVRDIANRVLVGLGYTVIASPSASEALELARNFAGTIDLLLTDVIMPEFSGRVLAERLAEHHPASKLLFMSGYTDDAVRRHGVKPSEIPYLQKPFSPHELGLRVRETLDAAVPVGVAHRARPGRVAAAAR